MPVRCLQARVVVLQSERGWSQRRDREARWVQAAGTARAVIGATAGTGHDEPVAGTEEDGQGGYVPRGAADEKHR